MSRKIMALVMLLAFVSQSVSSVAAVMTCQDHDGALEHSMIMPEMDHAMHQEHQNPGEPSLASCCGMDCDCSLGSCGVPVIPGTQECFSLGRALDDTSPLISFLKSHFASPHFRPPISG